MIILVIIIYIYYLRNEKLKFNKLRDQREIERKIKLENKIQDFEEFKNRLNQTEKVYRINTIEIFRNGYYVPKVNMIYKN